MAPQTRPRRSLPASRTYHSSPAPQQATFPARRRAVKTYGKAPTPSSVARSLRQQTLTQIDYLQLQQQPPTELEDDLDYMENSEEQPRKRRKTMGDIPSSTAGSSFHTQTLTQLLSEQGDDDNGEEGGILIGDSEDEDEDEDDLDLSLGLDNGRKDTESPRKEGSQASSMIPQTPAKKRIKTEIPSSQPSPFTPMLERYDIAPDRSPLKSRSTNVEAPPPTAETLNKRSRKMVVQDSYSTVNGGLSSDNGSQVFGQSPRKESRDPSRPPRGDSIRRLKPGLGFLDELAQEAHNVTVEVTENISTDGEIPDSDDEFDSFDPSPRKEESSIKDSPKLGSRQGTPTPRPRREEVSTSNEASIPQTQIQSPPQPTQLPQRNPTPEPDVDDEETQSMPSSPSPVRTRSVQSRSSFIEKETPLSSPQKTSPVKQPQLASSPSRTQYYTQGLESQRVPLEVIRDMGPQTDRSDIIISIHPEYVEKIAAGTKNHEFRDYRIPQTVKRIWIYVTKPVCELQYMASISEAKQPGEVSDEKGVGNAEFNRGEMSKFAYELQQVYQLNNPVSIDTMKENGWVGGPPQKYTYVPPAVVGQLMGNLRCALVFFDDEHDPADVGISVSQEVEMQLRSDITHATQMLSSDGVEMVPSSQEPTPRQTRAQSKQPQPQSPPFAKPMLPVKTGGRTTRSQAATPTKLGGGGGGGNDHYVRPSQATTVSEVSSPPLRTPEKSSSVARPQLCSSVPSLPEDVDLDGGLDLGVDESPIGMRLLAPGQQQFSIGSSQVLLEQDSLINDDDVRRPPVGWESDGE